MNADQDIHAVLCRTCGEPVHEHDRFCETCGNPAPTTTTDRPAPLDNTPQATPNPPSAPESPTPQATPSSAPTPRSASTPNSIPAPRSAPTPSPAAVSGSALGAGFGAELNSVRTVSFGSAPGAASARGSGPEVVGVAAGRPEAAVCVDCGGRDVGVDGYCGSCGLRQPSGREHVERVLGGGAAAAVSDLGLRRGRNEDAFALAALPRGACAVVCDGVATAPGSEEASRLAADAAAAVLARSVAAGADPRNATRQAAQRAGEIVTGLADGPQNAPACTFVSAIVDGPDVTVGWIGDSRAYWLSAEGPGAGAPRLLTRDDSWAGEMVERGEMSAADAWADRRAHLLTAWLGADGGAPRPRLAAFRPVVPGLVLICSDGLWNHLPEPAELAGVALDGTDGPGGPLGAVRRLLRAALTAGGHDNVTVAAIPCPPPESSRETSREPGR